jgi:Tfp pilus assembly protein PilO
MNKVRAWGAAAVVIVVAVFAIGWFVALSPQKADVKKLKDQAASETQSNEQLTSQIAVLKKQRSQLPAEQARIAAIKQRIPGVPGLTSYVRTLAGIAGATHVELVSIAPSQASVVQMQLPAAKASKKATANAGSSSTDSGAQSPAPAAPAPTVATSNLSAIPITIDVVGDYYAVQQFLAKLEDTTRATVVSSVDLAPGQLPQPKNVGPPAAGAAPTSSGNGNSWQTLEAQITVTVFMSTEPATGQTTSGSASSTATTATH